MHSPGKVEAFHPFWAETKKAILRRRNVHPGTPLTTSREAAYRVLAQKAYDPHAWWESADATYVAEARQWLPVLLVVVVPDVAGRRDTLPLDTDRALGVDLTGFFVLTRRNVAVVNRIYPTREDLLIPMTEATVLHGLPRDPLQQAFDVPVGWQWKENQ